MPRRTKTPPEKLLKALGGLETVSVADLQSRFGISERTLQRRLHSLVEDGALEVLGRGRYGPKGLLQPALSEEARELVLSIEASDADAHLTGYDILANLSHQFVYGYPHLVYCHPPHLDGLRSALTKGGWRVLPAGRLARELWDLERAVVLRGQTHAPGRYPVRGVLATPEKAWVDLLREVRRSGLPFDYGELGRLLRALERSGGRVETLNAYARRSGYLDWLHATRGEVRALNSEQRQLHAGYAA